MSAPGSHRVLVVDEEPLVRRGIACVLRDGGDEVRVCEAGDLDAAIAAARTCDPDLILLDSRLPGRRPAAAIPALRRAAPRARVVVLALHGDLRDVRDAFAAGAAAYVSKEAGPGELEHALARIHHGDRYLDPRLGAGLAVESAPAGADGLTQRERRVLELVARGLTNREISRELGLSARTIEGARSRAQHKLGLHSRADVVGYVLGG